ncbi:hypothetical protein Hanom_Chr01g00027141 [Helianthus anomalus]
MKFDLNYIVTISVMMLLSDLFVSSRCFRHRLGCDIGSHIRPYSSHGLCLLLSRHLDHGP